MRLTTPRTPRIRAAVAPAAWAAALLLALAPLPLGAQESGDAPAEGGPAPLETPPPSGAQDPAKDIFIEGIGFSKLVLDVKPPERLLREKVVSSHLMPLLEKNLCWSGLFTLQGGTADYCRPRRAPARVDMILRFGRQGSRMEVRLHDGGPERLVLYEDTLSLDRRVDESRVMALVNRMAERITGEAGLLGSTIAFVLRQPGYSKVIVATTTHGRRLRLISDNPDISLLPHWRPGGRGLVYTVLGRNGSAVYYHHLGTNGEALSSRFLTPRQGLNTGGAFAPDGERLVFTMSRGGSADLYQYHFESRELKRLTHRSGIETAADWHPGGQELVFVSDRSGTPQVYLLDLETGEDLRLTFDSSYNADPQWSPDGQRILFTKRVNGRDQIHIMDQYGENVRAVTSGPYNAEQAAWSPDGKQIVFTSNRTGEYKLYVVSADGSGLRRLTRTPERFEETSPSWTHRRFGNLLGPAANGGE